jgi:hypothetical protein
MEPTVSPHLLLLTRRRWKWTLVECSTGGDVCCSAGETFQAPNRMEDKPESRWCSPSGDTHWGKANRVTSASEHLPWIFLNLTVFIQKICFIFLWAGGVAQVIECLPSIYKAMSSKPSTIKKNFFLFFIILEESTQKIFYVVKKNLYQVQQFPHF